MRGQTRFLLKLLGNGQRFELLVELATRGPASHAELQRRLDMKPAAVSKRLGELEEAGLVERPSNNRAPWKLAEPAATKTALAGFAKLGTTVGRQQVRADARLLDELRAEPRDS